MTSPDVVPAHTRAKFLPAWWFGENGSIGECDDLEGTRCSVAGGAPGQLVAGGPGEVNGGVFTSGKDVAVVAGPNVGDNGTGWSGERGGDRHDLGTKDDIANRRHPARGIRDGQYDKEKRLVGYRRSCWERLHAIGPVGADAGVDRGRVVGERR